MDSNIHSLIIQSNISHSIDNILTYIITDVSNIKNSNESSESSESNESNESNESKSNDFQYLKHLYKYNNIDYKLYNLNKYIRFIYDY